MTDQALIRDYLERRNDDAFAQLVGRHIHWVNSMSRRLVRDPALADDVTQAVFILLAKKAGSLRRQTVISTWLFTVTRYCASAALRNERRRKKHERQAAAMRTETIEPAEWEEMSPMLDELVGRLRLGDRQALLMRFYEQKSFLQIGEIFEISEEAARKRVERAVEQLRGSFARKGVTVGAAALAATMSANLTQPASAALIAGATVSHTGASGSLVKSAGAMLFWASVKPIAAVIVCLLTLSAAATVLLQQAPPAQGNAAAPVPAPAAAPSTAPAVTTKTRFGRVLTLDDKPVPGARVWQLQWSEATDRTIPTASTITDAEGRFQFANTDKFASVLVQAQGYAFGGGLVRSRIEDDPSEIRVLPPANVHVRFVDPDGKPAVGLRVGLAGCGESRNGWRADLTPELEQSLAQTTDNEGACIFSGIPQGGMAWLDVFDERYARVGFSQWITLTDGTTVDAGVIHLERAASISGKVIFADSGKPATGIKVMSTAPGIGDCNAITDEQGRYEIKQLHAKEYCVFLFLSDELMQKVSAAAIENIRLMPGVHLEDQNFAIISGGTMRGRMVEKGTNKPVAGLSVDVEGPSRPPVTHTIQVAKTNADGFYQMHVPPGAQNVQFFDEPPGILGADPESVQINVADNQTVDVNFEVERSPSLPVKGRAVDPDGHPLANVEIFVQQNGGLFYENTEPASITNADGSFEIAVVEPDSRLRARRGKWTTLQPVTPSENVTLMLHPNSRASIHVAVKQSDGKPLAGAKVRLLLGDRTSEYGEHLTDTEGNCTFRSVAPDSRYIVSADANGFGIVETRIAIQPGQLCEVPPIVLPKADSFIAGMVIDENGQPLPDIEIIAGIRGHGSMTKTDINGRFRFDGIVPGDQMRVSSRKDRLSPFGSAQTIPAGTQDAVIIYKPTTQP